MFKNKLTLMIDSCLADGSAAVWSAGECLAAADSLKGPGGRIEILPVIARLLRSQGLDIGGIRQIGFTRGPGSYTGIRVGMATVQGLVSSLGAAAFSCTTLEALTALVPDDAVKCVAVMPAGRSEYVSQYFAREGRKEGFYPLGEMTVSANTAILEISEVGGVLTVAAAPGVEEAVLSGFRGSERMANAEIRIADGNPASMARRFLIKAGGSSDPETIFLPLYTRAFLPGAGS